MSPARGASPSASAPLDAGRQLATALHAVDGQSLRLMLTARGGDLECDYEVGVQSFSCAGDTRDGALDMVCCPDGRLYLRMPPTGARFLRYDINRLPGRLDLLILLDPMIGRRLLDAATGVRTTAPGTLDGVVDLAKAPVTGADRRIADLMAAQAGGQAAALPFTATVDAQGRLTGIRLVPGGSAEALYAVKITEIGAGVTVVPPARDRWTDAPSSAYR